MLIQIVSKNIDVSPALTARINERFDEMMDKYIRREGEAQVSVSREGTGFRTVCSVTLWTILTLTRTQHRLRGRKTL